MSTRRSVIIFGGISLALVTVASVILLLVAPPYIERAAVARAAKRGLVLRVGRVSLGLRGAVLSGSSATLDGLPGVRITFARAEVSWKGVLTVPKVSVRVDGRFAQVHKQLTRWRRLHLVSRSSHKRNQGAAGRVRVGSIDLRWNNWNGAGTEASVKGLDGSVLHDLDSVRARQMIVRGDGGVIEAFGIAVQGVQRGGARMLHTVTAKRVTASLGGAGKGSVAESAPVKQEATETRGVDAASRGRRRTGASGGGASPTKRGRLQKHVLRFQRRLQGAGIKMAHAFSPGGSVRVEEMSVVARTGAGNVRFGPGRLKISFGRKAVDVRLEPKVGGSVKGGIVFHAVVPLTTDAMDVSVQGGPVPLASLGVREGDLGLVQVGRAKLFVDTKVAVDEKGSQLSFDGTVRSNGLGVSFKKLAGVPVTGLSVAVRMKGEMRFADDMLVLREAEADLGRIAFHLDGKINVAAPADDIDIRFHVPTSSCGDLLAALPATLAPKVQGMKARGSVSLRGALRFVRAKRGSFAFQYTAHDSCRYVAVPQGINIASFRVPFVLHAYDAHGKPLSVKTGPGTRWWADLGAISRFMEVAVMTTEDAGFRRHQGFDHEAIRNSVRDNLLARKFLRGASTISMQLAKNLLLNREKTVGRKLQELILTDYLEQALTKDQILELYLNVIEFGPGMYGVRKAAAHYFHTSPGALTLSQCLYLSSILPNPKRQHFAAGGRVSVGWMNYLYKLMKLAARRGWIGEDDLDEGLREWVVFGHPEPELAPEPETGGTGADGGVGEGISDPFTPPGNSVERR